MRHALKTWPAPFEAVVDGRKRFELRVDDRPFRVDDTLLLQEWDPTTAEYTGRNCAVRVLYILASGFGLPEGYVCMSIEVLP